MPEAASLGNVCGNVADFRAKALAAAFFFVYRSPNVPASRREAFARFCPARWF